MMSNLIVFTDLDGTLLNHDNYGYEVVLPYLQKLQAKNIPVILNSSKTLSELEKWQSLLNLSLPVIAENGGVISLYSDLGEIYKIVVGQPYQKIRHLLVGIRETKGWQFEGFGDWAVGDVMNKTGLKVSEAVRAKEREATEPILWMDAPETLKYFEAYLAEHQLRLVKGGRFYHVMGHHSKADAMHFLVNKDYFSCGLDCEIVALGDSQNDLDMLRYAHLPMVLPNAKGEKLEVKGAYYAEQSAPEGWVECIKRIL